MTSRRLFVKVRPLVGAAALGALAAGERVRQVTPRGGEVFIPDSSQEATRTHRPSRSHEPQDVRSSRRHGKLRPTSSSGGVRPRRARPMRGISTRRRRRSPASISSCPRRTRMQSQHRDSQPLGWCPRHRHRRRLPLSDGDAAISRFSRPNSGCRLQPPQTSRSSMPMVGSPR